EPAAEVEAKDKKKAKKDEEPAAEVETKKKAKKDEEAEAEVETKKKAKKDEEAKKAPVADDSESDSKAQLGKEIELELVAADLPPGTPVTFAVTQVGFGPIGEASASASSGGATARWSDWYNFDRVTSRVELAAGQPFPEVRFTFVATANGVPVPSAAPLAYADTLNAQLIGDDGAGMADADYQLVSPWGTRAGTARSDGTFDEPGLPPGGVTVLVNSRGTTH
ncbi:MAG: hypothetical protein H7138_04935, partial [Myxococcales bacterium]|nr:hypothetical protein [Myxococcales bacterium]